MDPYDHRHHYDHHTRYASHPPPPSLPSNRFPDDLNFPHHRTHPDRLPPPPRPHSFQYYPSPPRIPIDHRPYPHPQPRFIDDHPPPPRIREPPPDEWDPPRVFRQDDRIVQWDHPPRHPPGNFNNPPLSPPPPYRDSKRFDFDDISKPREGFNFGKFPREGLDWNKKEEFVWGERERENDIRNSSVRRSRGPSSSSLGFTFGKGREREEALGENIKWGSAKMGNLGHKPAVVRVEGEGKTGSEELWLDDHGEEFWGARGKRLHSQLKSDNFLVIPNRDGSQEFGDNSKQKVKRTSALLRVGRTPTKWKDDDDTEYFGMVNGGSSSERGPVDFENLSVNGNKLDGSVDLDVSFKSNALVAKPIVPPSDHATGSDGRSISNSNKKSRSVTPVFSVSSPRVTEIHQKSPSAGGSDERVSPINKKRKVMTSVLGVSNPLVTEINEKSPSGDVSTLNLDVAAIYNKALTPPKDKATFAGNATAVAISDQPGLKNRTLSSIGDSAKKMLYGNSPTQNLDDTSGPSTGIQSENQISLGTGTADGIGPGICSNKITSPPKTGTKEISHLSNAVDSEPLNGDNLTLKLGAASACSIELFQSSNKVVNTGIRTGDVVCSLRCLDEVRTHEKSSKEASPSKSAVCSDKKPLHGNRSTRSAKVKQSKTSAFVSGDGTGFHSLIVSGKAPLSSKHSGKNLSVDNASSFVKGVSLIHPKDNVCIVGNELSIPFDMVAKEKTTSNTRVDYDDMLSKDKAATTTLGTRDAVDILVNDKPLSGNSSSVKVDAVLVSDKDLTQSKEKVTVSGLGVEDCIKSQTRLNRNSAPNEATKTDRTSSSTMVVMNPLNRDSSTPALDISSSKDVGMISGIGVDGVLSIMTEDAPLGSAASTAVLCTPKMNQKRKRKKNKNVAAFDSGVHAPVPDENVSATALPAPITKINIPVSYFPETLGKSSIENSHLGSTAGFVVSSPNLKKNTKKKKIKETVSEIGLQASVMQANTPVSGFLSSVGEVGVACGDNSVNSADATLDSVKSSTKLEEEVILASRGITDDDRLPMVNTSVIERDDMTLLPSSSFGAKDAELVKAVMSIGCEKASMRSDNSLMQFEEEGTTSNLHRTNLLHKNTAPVKSLFMDELSGRNKRKRRKNKGVNTFLGLSSSRPSDTHEKLDISADDALPADEYSRQSVGQATVPGNKLENDGVQSLHKVNVRNEKTKAVKSLPCASLGSAMVPKVKRKSVFDRISSLSSSGVITIHEGSGNSDRPDYMVGPPNYGKPKQNMVVLSNVQTVDDNSSHVLPSLLENSLEEKLPVNMVSVSNAIEGDNGNSAQPIVISGSLVENSVIPNGHFSSSLGFQGELNRDNIPFVVTGNSLQCAIPDDELEPKDGERAGNDADPAGELRMLGREKGKQIVLHSLVQEKFDSLPSELQISVFSQKSVSKATENDVYTLLENSASPPLSTYVPPREEVSGTSITNSNGEGVDSVPGRHVRTDDQYSSLTVNDLHKEPTSDPDENMFSDQTEETEHPNHKKTLLLSSSQKPQTTSTLIRKVGERIGGKTSQGPSLSRPLPGRAPVTSAYIKKTDSVKVAGPRTWHRTGNPPLPQIAPSFRAGPSQKPTAKKIQSTSYIRKGNSLVRNCVPAATIPQTSGGLTNSSSLSNRVSKDELRNTVSEHKVSCLDPKNYSTAGLERPKTPPLSYNVKLPINSIKSSLAVASSTLSCPFLEGASETTIPVFKNADNHVEASEIQNVGNKESEVLVLSEDAKSQSSKRNEITYVKPKSNQLVASGSTEDHGRSSSCTPFDQYYKKNKNQLIRNALSSRSPLTEAVGIADGSLNSESQRVPDVPSFQGNRSIQKQNLDKAFVETHKASRLSLVWTLHGTQTQKQDVSSFQRRMIYPILFPWKRNTRWKSFKFNSIYSKGSFSRISKKLLLSHKRDTIYTRSTGGFSLRKSKVLSIGGSNLKWSKSIETRLKKANEEATLAVAAIERKKREQKGVAVRTAKRRNQSSRERIFRIGSVRYKMDASKHSLQRIPDEESSCVAGNQSAKDTKKAFIPKRLLIDNDEYIRIGNGNKLVRDPKKLVRILASEKVRWSLHTARLRLARKQQYCQFFTRFGKCNKGDGKCPYIHDPSKIAVCTKFLKGLCSNASCKLTHKVIPERMEDCSYFLQGLCTNESCPYRHVNVNPNASVCEGFLRGYCASGNECRKKHSYMCPIFKSTGVCPQRSLCKLRHPKKQNKTKKKSKELKNNQRRYFGTELSDTSDRAVCSDKHTEKKSENIFTNDGGLAEYVSIDVSDDEDLDMGDLVGKYTKLCDSDSDLQPTESDEDLKPVLLMNKNPS